MLQQQVFKKKCHYVCIEMSLNDAGGGTSSVNLEGEMKREQSKPSLVFTAPRSLPAAES